jgi:hypothetical protein
MSKLHKYEVRVVKEIVYTTSVFAKRISDAEQIAAGGSDVYHEHAKVHVSATALARTDEPWVLGWSGEDTEDTGNLYYGRPDGYGESDDLLVFQRAYGCLFSVSDVELLKTRAECVGEIAETWNGAGYNTLSIRFAKPIGKLTDEQVKALMAPRPEST